MPTAINWTPEQDATIATMRSALKSWDQIAAVLKVHRWTVIQRATRIGVSRENVLDVRRAGKEVG